MGDDPETLLRFANVNYAEPAWFVRPEEPDPASVVLFEDVETTEDPLESLELAQGSAPDDQQPPTAVDDETITEQTETALEPAPQPLPPAAEDQQPLSPEERRALALATAEAKLAERIEQDRLDLAARTLVFEDAMTLAETFPLRSALQRVERAPGMRVLFAGSWLTEPTPRDALAPLWLQLPETGLDLIEEPEADATAEPGTDAESALDLGVLRPLAPNDEPGLNETLNDLSPGADDWDLPPAPPRHPLEGTIAVSKGRYLHAALQLVFDDPLAAPPVVDPAATDEDPGGDGSARNDAAIDLRAPLSQTQAEVAAVTQQPSTAVPMTAGPVVAAGEQTAPTLVHLAQRRRMKSSELHYIDHPRLGVLIRVDPIELPAETAAVVAQVEALKQLNR